MPRHYTANFNFRLTGDLPLQREQPLHTQQVRGDSVWLRSGDEVVVAQIAVIPEDTVDTVWVKLARDQMTQGWVREGRMMESVVPSAAMMASSVNSSRYHLSVKPPHCARDLLLLKE